MYLAGPINNCTDSECKDWREAAKQIFQGYKFLDPMARDYRGKEDQSVKEIVEGDKKDIDASQILVVNYDKPSVGTSMEVLYAWERDKEVFIIAAPGTRISPWLRYHSLAVFESLEALAQHLAIRWRVQFSESENAGWGRVLFSGTEAEARAFFDQTRPTIVKDQAIRLIDNEGRSQMLSFASAKKVRQCSI
jgi:hypothetical protein